MFQFVKDLCWGKRTPFGLELENLILNEPENMHYDGGYRLTHGKYPSMYIWIDMDDIGSIQPNIGGSRKIFSYQDQYYIKKAFKQNLYRMKFKCN